MVFRSSQEEQSGLSFFKELKELIKEFRVQIIGPFRQEVLSGIRLQDQFEQIKEHLRSFRDLEISSSEYERAVGSFNMAC